MEERWGFLAPWCTALVGRMKYKAVDRDWEIWAESRHRLQVKLPMRFQISDDEIYDIYENGDESEDSYDSDSSGGYYCDELKWEGEKIFRKRFHKVREALALLAAVAHVDQAAWKYLLVTHCGVALGRPGEVKFEKDIPPHYCLILEQDEDWRTNGESHLGLDLALFCNVSHRTNPSGDYLRTLARIAALDDRLTKDEPGVDIFIPVQQIYPSLGGSTDGGPKILENTLMGERAIQKMWSSLGHEDVQPGMLRCTFVLQPMIAEFQHICDWREMVEKVGALIRDNLWFAEVSSRAILSTGFGGGESTARKLLGELMTHFFNSSRRSRELTYCARLDSQEHQIGTLALTCHTSLQGEDVGAMMSAAVANQTVGNVSLYMGIGEDSQAGTDEWWHWIAYAFFSRRARHLSALESLALVNIETLPDVSMEKMGPIVRSKHPEEVLFNLPRGRIPERYATLKANSPIRWQFDYDGLPVLAYVGADVLTFPVPVQNVWTFSDDGESEWINIMMPGYGRCQVLRGDLEFGEPLLLRTDAPPLTSLTIGFHKWEEPCTDGLRDFLAAVGRHLKTLTIDGPRSDLDERVIFRCCPRLEVLSVCGGLVDAEISVTKYRAAGKRSGYQRINWHSVAALTDALSSTSNRLASCVRRLRVRLQEPWHRWGFEWGTYNPPNFADDVNAFLRMLELNRSIEYFEITVPGRHHGYVDAFRRHHLTRVAGSVPIKAKLAFLSVLSGQTGGDDDDMGDVSQQLPARRQLEQHLVSHVLKFAAPLVVRKVYFRALGDEDVSDDDDDDGFF